MVKRMMLWVFWILSIPIIIITFIYSFFITSQIAYLPQTECYQEFIFALKDVQNCSEIYPIDKFIISLNNRTNFIYLCRVRFIFNWINHLFIYRVVKETKGNLT
jgi:hypothetical protein